MFASRRFGRQNAFETLVESGCGQVPENLQFPKVGRQTVFRETSKNMELWRVAERREFCMVETNVTVSGQKSTIPVLHGFCRDGSGRQ